MLDRRTFVLSGTALGALSIMGCATRRAPDGGRDVVLDRMLSDWFYADLVHNPEFATNLGLDRDETAALRGQLSDQSIAGISTRKAEAIARLAELRRFGRRGLTPAATLNYEIAMFRQSVAAEAARFAYGEFGGRPAPYVISQLGGAYYSVPDFLDTQHPIETREDADAYIARLEDFAVMLDHESERLARDVGLGVIPPDFVLAKAIPNLESLRGTSVADTVMVKSIARRAAAKGLGTSHAEAAARIVRGPIFAALDRQIGALKALRGNATHDAGVWRLPDGVALYALGLRANTTTGIGADEIHRIGLAQVSELTSRTDTLMRAEGYTRGTVGERMHAINVEPRFLFPNTDAGRAALLASLNAQVARIKPLLPRVFATLPKAEVEIRRVPPTIEAGAPGGYYQAASLDGSRPGAYYINLKDTHEWPSNGLPTLTWHEAMPGHHFQTMVSREAGELPLYRRARGFSAYGEGWALYAERVADELGVYEGDPFGKIGFLQSYLFRAVRLVVDTGLHHKRWSREQAIRYMIETAGEPEGAATREIERYSVWPGQACAYKMGETVISRLRAEAESRQSGFDIKAFHDRVLLSGAMPLSVLERHVRDGI